jgi:integrase
VARTIVDSNLKDRTARSRLKARGKPYYRLIEEGLHVGYRRPRGRRGKPAPAGKWVVRRYTGKQTYVVETLAAADDFSDSDGVAVLDFAQAQNRARELHVQSAHAAAGIAGPLTVAAALDIHFEFLAGRGQGIVNQKYHGDGFITPALGDVEVAKLTTKQLRKWHHNLAKLPPRVRTKAGEPQQHRAINTNDAEAARRRKSSANRILTTLKAALNHVWREEKLVPSDVEWRRVEPFKKVDGARTDYLQIPQAKRLINAADPVFRPVVQTALATGCRYGEVCRLKVQDFNPDAGTLAIWQSKSGKPRHVVLTDEGVALFTELTAGRDSGELILHRANGDAWGRGHQNRFMAAACERAKIKPVGIHILRHTWASLAVMSGMPLMIVAKNLGHSDSKMVEKHYGHLAPSYIADAIRAHAPKFGFKPGNVAVIR